MNILKADPEQVVIPPTPIETDMTLEEFLESDLEGCEYVKGALNTYATDFRGTR